MNECARGVLSCLCFIIVVQIIVIAVQAASGQDVGEQVGSLVAVMVFACCIGKVAERSDHNDDGPQVVVMHREPEPSEGQVNVVRF